MSAIARFALSVAFGALLVQAWREGEHFAVVLASVVYLWAGLWISELDARTKRRA